MMTLHVNMITPLPQQWIHRLCFHLMYCGGLYLLQADCYLLSVASVEVGSGTRCYCSSSVCVAVEPAAGRHLSAEHLPSGSHTERGGHSVQWFHSRHQYLLLEAQMRKMNCTSSN